MVTRIIRKEDLNVSTVSSDSYKLNAQAYSIINKFSNIKRQVLWWDAPGLALVLNNISILIT
jgi:hypothetical protein